MIQAVAGLSTAGPMFFLGLQALRDGNGGLGLFFLASGVVLFFLPGMLMDRILQQLIETKDRVVTNVKEKTANLLPSIPFLR